jgi:DNA-binding transcriptional LysR family regulator
MSVTDTGAAFYERCKLAIEAADDAMAVAHKDQPVSGTLRIAAPHGLGRFC